MSSRTKFKPHAISCIKDSIQQVLEDYSGDNLTVSCDRDDCWEDRELMKWRQAINIVTRNDIIGSPVKRARENKRLSDSRTQQHSECQYEAILNVDVQVYVSECDCGSDCGCMDIKSKAYAVMAHVVQVLTANQSQILGKRIIYQGSDNAMNTEGEDNLVVVTGAFQVHYLFDQTRPWVVGQ